MCMGFVIVGIYVFGDLSRVSAVMTLGCFLGVDLLIETARLHIPAFNAQVMKYWGALMRKSEINRLSGTPYYIGSAVLTIGVFPKPIAVLSLLYLACGDPLASAFGILYGDRSIRFKSGKSLIGTMAGVLTCFLISLVFFNMYGVNGLTLALLSVLGAIAGAPPKSCRSMSMIISRYRWYQDSFSGLRSLRAA